MKAGIIKGLFMLAMLGMMLVTGSCSAPLGTETRVATRALATEEVETPVTKQMTSTPVPSMTATPTRSPVASITPTQTPEPTSTSSWTPTVTPTYAILRGEVLVRSNCRYGPGWPHLYKYGLPAGSNLEVIGRIPDGSWILVQAIGGSNPCWLKASLMDVQGEVMSVQPTTIPLPQSPYYGPVAGVSATRDGDMVTITWHTKQLRAGDETASPQYLVEAWVCEGGSLAYVVTGTDWVQVELRDEQGCSEPSHGRVYLMEKHGYTRPAEVPWPVWEISQVTSNHEIKN